MSSLLFGAAVRAGLPCVSAVSGWSVRISASAAWPLLSQGDGGDPAMSVSSPSRLPGCVLLSRGQGSKTMGVSKASGGLVSPPQSVGQTRFKAHPDSGGEKNELHLFLFFSFLFFSAKMEFPQGNIEAVT